MNTIKVSVITPCYNVEKYIEECLDSILTQSLHDVEALCFDDGSTDGTLSILKSYQEKDPRVLVIEQENSGPSVARNKGLSLARGEFVSFVDSDDLLAPDAFKKCYDLASEYCVDTVHFNAEPIFEIKEFENSPPYFFNKNTYIRAGYEIINNHETPTDGASLFAKMYQAGDYRMPIWLSFYSNEFLRKHNFRFIEGILHADDVFNFETIMSSKSVAFCENVLYFRRFRSDSIMTTPIGRRNAISRIIGQKQIQTFLDSIAPELPENVLLVAKEYVNERRSVIVDKFIQYLSDNDDAEYFEILASLDEKTKDAPPRLKRIIKSLFSRS